ncbi:MAG: hypothetical protein AB7V62_16270 [Thermoleophilia bacterium]
MTTQPADRGPDSDWATAGVMFAAVLMILTGVLQILQGIAAIADDDLFLIGSDYAYDINVAAWGWIHLVIGAVVFAAGVALLRGALWAGMLGIAMAVIAAVANFFFLPYYPFWAIVLIAMNVWIIWALTRPGALAGT